MNKYTELIIILIAISIVILLSFFIYNKEGFTENYLDGVDIIYWINLDRSKDRYNDMNELFKDDCFANIPNERIAAFDGKLNSELMYSKLVLNEKNISDNEYGCLLSHLEAIRIFNQTDNKVALIVEDDMNLEFKKYWKESIKQIMNNAPSDWEIIQLNYILMGDDPFYNWNTADNYIKGGRPSTLSYIINKKGSNKIINSTYINNKYVLVPKVGHAADSYMYSITNTYRYKYPMFIYKSDDMVSTIDNGHNNINLESKNSILEQYKKLYNI